MTDGFFYLPNHPDRFANENDLLRKSLNMIYWRKYMLENDLFGAP